MLGSILLIIIFTFLNAIFASAEIAVISMKEARLKHLTEEGNKRAKKLSALVEQPSRFLATIQVAITLSGFLNSAFASDNFASVIVDALLAAGVPIPASTLNSIAVLLVTVLLSYISIVLGELVPKRIAMKNPEKLSMALASMLYSISRVFSPIVSLLTVSANGLLRLFGVNPTDEEEQITKEEIQMMLMEGNEQGIIDTQENEFIQNVFEFNDNTAEQICTHRSDVIILDADDTAENWKEIIYGNRYSFYPVYKDSKENIIGILDTKDYFRLEDKTMENIAENAIKPAFFVPENIKATKLFSEMKKTRNYFSILVNEYGEMAGIVTLHDLVEELVGEIYEEDETDEEKIRQLSSDTWCVKGDAELDDVSKALGIEISEEEYDTFNGFIYSIIDQIPKDGSQFTCEANGMVIHVNAVENHKIVDAIVRVKKEEPAEEQE